MGWLSSIFGLSPKESKVHIETVVSYRNSTEAETLMKEASLLKKEKRYDEAILKINEAFNSEGSNYLGLPDKLKLVTYLQLNKQFDEAWRVLNEVNVLYTSAESQHAISDKMRLHFQREGKFDYAIPLGIYSLIKEVEYRKDILGASIYDSDVNEGFRNLKSIEHIENIIDSLIKKSTKQHLRDYFIDITNSMINSDTRYNYRDVLNIINKKE